MRRYVFTLGALIATLYCIIIKDTLFAALMGEFFGFQLALLLVDREAENELRKLKRSSFGL